MRLSTGGTQEQYMYGIYIHTLLNIFLHGVVTDVLTNVGTVRTVHTVPRCRGGINQGAIAAVPRCRGGVNQDAVAHDIGNIAHGTDKRYR